MAVTPDATQIVIGDRGGHLHVLPSDVTAESLAAAIEDVSFVGHNAAVSLLDVSRDGRLAASAADDDSVRVWNLEDGQPFPHMAEMPGGGIADIDFSDDASLLAVLNGTRVVLLDTSTGEEIAEFLPGEQHRAVAFAGNDRVYLGGQSGALRVISRDAAGAWNLRQLWQGTTPIQTLEASYNGRSLLLVSGGNQVQQLNLENGALGSLSLKLPDTIEALSFSPVGSRVFIRTARWVHRASSSSKGLIWLDAVFGPNPIHGAGLVHVTSGSDSTELFLPVLRGRHHRARGTGLRCFRGARFVRQQGRTDRRMAHPTRHDGRSAAERRAAGRRHLERVKS